MTSPYLTRETRSEEEAREQVSQFRTAGRMTSGSSPTERPDSCPIPANQIEISEPQLRIILLAVEHGFRLCERGHNLEMALKLARDLYTVKAEGR